MRRWAWLLTFALPLSGCLGGAPEQPAATPPAIQTSEIAILEDETGDARIWETRDVIEGGIRRTCDFLPTGARDGCQSIQKESSGAPQMGGRPAPPFMDIVRANAVASSDEILLSLEVAALEQHLEGLAEDGSEMVVWALSYARHGDWPESLYVRATKDDGKVYTYGGARESETACGGNKTTNPDCEVGCNAYWWCEVGVRTTFEYGEPGRIVFHLPASEFAEDWIDMEEITASTSIRVQPFGEATTGWRLDAGSSSDRGWTNPGVTMFADQAGPAAPVSVAIPTTNEGPTKKYRVELPRGPTSNAALDVVAVTTEATPERFSLVAELVEVEATPSEDHDFKFYLSTSSGRSFFVAYWAKEGVRTNTFWEAADASGGWSALPVELEVVPGPFGQVRFNVARGDLGVAPGEVVNHFWLHVHDYIDEGLATPTGAGLSAFHNVNHEAEALPAFQFE